MRADRGLGGTGKQSAASVIDNCARRWRTLEKRWCESELPAPRGIRSPCEREDCGMTGRVCRVS